MIYLQSPEEKVWERFVADGASCEELVEPLQRSWQRSVMAGASAKGPHSSLGTSFLGPQALKERREVAERAWHHVEPVIERLSHQLARGGFLGVWADEQGVILHCRGGGTFLTTAQRVELLEGANWQESARGTNAIGTALRESCEVAVFGRAHLQRSNHDLACYASPVHDPQGRVIGVLDVTSRMECAQDMAPVALLAARSAVELSLKLAAYEDTLRGGLEGLCQSLEFFPSPVLLVERDGTLRACNSAYRKAFGVVQKPGEIRWNWESSGGNSGSVIMYDVAGRERLCRVSVEPVGPSPETSVAMLVFVEPLGASRVFTPSSPSHASVTSRHDAFTGMFGSDPEFCRTLQLAERFAPSDLPVLLLANTGTGKERLARAVHDLSNRRHGPFVAINCGALSGSLLQAELFGYADGAFTGARKGGSSGKIASASGGTLFLDEVAEMPADAQAMLLRVLEDGSYYRVGDVEPRHADVRIVAATCQDMAALVASRAFRSDLYFRLKGATLTLPKLCERTDVEPLARFLLSEIHGDAQGAVPTLSQGFVHAIEHYRWPGNVRELRNALHVAWVLGGLEGELRFEHLPPDIQQVLHDEAPAMESSSEVGTKDSAERGALTAALEKARGNMSQAARTLGVARSTLYRMMERHGLR